MKTNTLSACSLVSIALAAFSISLGGCAVSTDESDAIESDEAVAEAQEAVTTVPFPGSFTAALGTNTLSGYEPSGLAWYDGTVYMASDNGKIARYASSTNSWSKVLTYNDSRTGNPADFESLTVAVGATANQLMVGIEGSSSHSAQIANVNVAGQSLGNKWTLSNVSNMEAMTFVPDINTPFGSANTAAHPSDFNGYFFVATQKQEDLGTISVYRLDTGASHGTLMYVFDIDIMLQTSDLCFANGVLYALFDDHNATDLLAVYVINTNANNKMLAFQKQYALPSVNNMNFNYEGIAFDRQTIYLGRDDNNNSSNNGVYKFANTIIYPQIVLPPLSW